MISQSYMPDPAAGTDKGFHLGGTEVTTCAECTEVEHIWKLMLDSCDRYKVKSIKGVRDNWLCIRKRVFRERERECLLRRRMEMGRGGKVTLFRGRGGLH